MAGMRMAGRGWESTGGARQERLGWTGTACTGWDRLGRTGQVWLGHVRLRKDWKGRRLGQALLGPARLGSDR